MCVITDCVGVNMSVYGGACVPHRPTYIAHVPLDFDLVLSLWAPDNTLGCWDSALGAVIYPSGCRVPHAVWAPPGSCFAQRSLCRSVGLCQPGSHTRQGSNGRLPRAWHKQTPMGLGWAIVGGGGGWH